MPRQLLKRIVPPPHTLQDRWFVRLFGERISDPHLWTLHRRGVMHDRVPVPYDSAEEDGGGPPAFRRTRSSPTPPQE